MSKPRGQKAPRRFLQMTVLNLRPPVRERGWFGYFGSNRGTMTAISLRTSSWLATAILPITFLIFPADATTTCPVEQSKAIEKARRGFDAGDPEKGGAALVCLAEAVATLGA
jgi:hypothetical protein